MDIEKMKRARAIVAERYQPSGPNSRNICRDAILRGDWDRGKLVQDEVARLGDGA